MQQFEWWDFPEDPIRSDFRTYLYIHWAHLGLPEPTFAQLEFAYFLQHGYPGVYRLLDGRLVKRFDLEWYNLTDAERAGATQMEARKPTGRNEILEAFRGVGKSWVAAAYCCWLLLRDPVDEKILVVSKSGSKAKEFVSQVKTVIATLDVLAHLRPGVDAQRDKQDAFDVAGASISQSPSLRACGIDGQITGSRATTIIADDIETPTNSATEEARLKILAAVNEFDAIILPLERVQILFLGTPQTEESVYLRIIKERGFSCFCYPVRYPKAEKRGSYILDRTDGSRHDILAPCLRGVDTNPDLQWKPTDPQRFDETQILSRESKGAAWFALQFMLDTSLSDAERYPLKQKDLIVMSCHPQKAPMMVQWGRHSDGGNIRKDIQNAGFTGDYLMGPLFVDKEWREYTALLGYVDPGGGGKDETAWAIVGELNGVYYLLRVFGMAGDVALAMAAIARDCMNYNVRELVYEPNYGGQMWEYAFSPILARVGAERKTKTTEAYSCSIVKAEWSKGMKEARIIDTLEPVLNTHKVVVDEQVAHDREFIHQLTHIAKMRGALPHEDRLDAFAGAISHLKNAAAVDMGDARDAQLQEELDAELQDFIETCTLSSGGAPRTGRQRRRGRRLPSESEWGDVLSVDLRAGMGR